MVTVSGINLNRDIKENNVSPVHINPYGVRFGQTGDKFNKSVQGNFPGKSLGLTYAYSSGNAGELNELFDFVNAIEVKMYGKKVVQDDKRLELISDIRQQLQSDKGKVLVIRDREGKLVGCGQVAGWNGGAWLYHIHLDEQYRGKKIGRWITEELLRYAHENPQFDGTAYLNVTNPVARRLYESLGFHALSEEPAGQKVQMVRKSQRSFLDKIRRFFSSHVN